MPATEQSSEPKSPVKQKDGRGWYIGNYCNDGDVNIVVESMRENVRIQNCSRCTVKIAGKSAAIVVDRCEKLRLEFDAVISAVEILNGNQIDLRPRSNLKSVRVEKTESIVIYLNPLSIDCKVIHHLSYPVVIMVPRNVPDAEGEETGYEPMTLPTMFESQWDGMKFVTKASEYC